MQLDCNGRTIVWYDICCMVTGPLSPGLLPPGLLPPPPGSLPWSFAPLTLLLTLFCDIREWSLITGRGGLQNGRGGHEVLPLRKGGAEKVLAILKGGAQKVLG